MLELLAPWMVVGPNAQEIIMEREKQYNKDFLEIWFSSGPNVPLTNEELMLAEKSFIEFLYDVKTDPWRASFLGNIRDWIWNKKDQLKFVQPEEWAKIWEERYQELSDNVDKYNAGHAELAASMDKHWHSVFIKYWPEMKRDLGIIDDSDKKLSSSRSKLVRTTKYAQEYTKKVSHLDERRGFIYLIKSNNLVKIGKSNNPTARFKTYTTENPFGVEMLFTFEIDSYGKIEKELHLKFKDKRIRGEWFNLTEEDVMEIKKQYV